MKTNKKRITVFFLMIMMVIGCLSSVSAASFTKTEKTTYRRLTQVEKFSAKDACAIMGEMKSASNVNYSAVEQNGAGHGVMQWSFGRYKALKKAAKKEKKSWKDGGVQRKFIKSEFKSMGISKKLNKTSSLKEKSKIITKNYVKPANPEASYKISYKHAKKYYDNRKSLK